LDNTERPEEGCGEKYHGGRGGDSTDDAVEWDKEENSASP